MLTKSLIVAATALAAGTAMSLPADAQPNKEIRGAVVFWLLDRNNDGAIDRSEVEALRTVIFDAVDTDDDGKVTREEFIAVIGERGGPRDGPLHERGERGGPRHGQLEDHGRHEGPRGGEHADGRGPGAHHGQWEDHGRHGGSGQGDFAEHRGGRMMDRLGIDGGGGLDRDDFVGAAPILFERADEDDDGSVSQAEFEQASGHIGRLLILE